MKLWHAHFFWKWLTASGALKPVTATLFTCHTATNMRVLACLWKYACRMYPSVFWIHTFLMWTHKKNCRTIMCPVASVKSEAACKWAAREDFTHLEESGSSSFRTSVRPAAHVCVGQWASCFCGSLPRLLRRWRGGVTESRNPVAPEPNSVRPLKLLWSRAVPRFWKPSPQAIWLCPVWKAKVPTTNTLCEYSGNTLSLVSKGKHCAIFVYIPLYFTFASCKLSWFIILSKTCLQLYKCVNSNWLCDFF